MQLNFRPTVIEVFTVSAFPEALPDPEEGEVADVLVLVGQQLLEDVVRGLADALQRGPDALLGRRVDGGQRRAGTVEVLRRRHLARRDARLAQQAPQQRVGEEAPRALISGSCPVSRTTPYFSLQHCSTVIVLHWENEVEIMSVSIIKQLQIDKSRADETCMKHKTSKQGYGI